LGIEVPYQLHYHPDVRDKDLPKIDRNIQKRIKAAIEKRLLEAPERYSEPLRRTLKGYRKLRVGDYRIVLKLQGENILILGICHRKDVYERMEWRIQ
jgi:mRNA interferase RelE/StbE